MSTRDTTLLVQLLRFSLWQETLQAATSNESGLKGNRLMHLLCKFHMRVGYS